MMALRSDARRDPSDSLGSELPEQPAASDRRARSIRRRARRAMGDLCSAHLPDGELDLVRRGEAQRGSQGTWACRTLPDMSIEALPQRLSSNLSSFQAPILLFSYSSNFLFF